MNTSFEQADKIRDEKDKEFLDQFEKMMEDELSRRKEMTEKEKFRHFYDNF